MLNFSTNSYLTYKEKLLFSSWKYKPLTLKKIQYFQFFFFFSNLLFFFFKFNFFFILNLKNSLAKKHTYSFFKNVSFFFHIYASHFKQITSLFFFFSKYVLFFLFNKNLHSMTDFLLAVFSSSSRMLQFKLFRILICVSTFIKNFFLNRENFQGVFFQLKGKLSWKALSRKKKTVYYSGKTKKSQVSMKNTSIFCNLRTITGSVGLGLSLFF